MVFPNSSLAPTTDLVFLGVGCDTTQRRFYVPEGKLLKLEAILREAIDSQSISFSQLEKLEGKCTSMSVAVSTTSLYTHHMYPQIAAFKRSRGRKNSSSIAVSDRSSLRFEMERWLEVRTQLNGAPWYDATRHVLTITGATDASSQAWEGLIRGPFGAFSVFKAAADFPTAWHNAHINVKKTFALHEALKLLIAITTHPGSLKGSTAVVDVDNKTMYDAFKKERSRNAQTYNLTTKLFWLQVKKDLTLDLRWVSSEANWAADRFDQTRTHGVRPAFQAAFHALCKTLGEGNTDLMATNTSTQRTPTSGGVLYRRLPFHSRFHTNGSSRVDVFSHNVNRMPDSLRTRFGYYFPQRHLWE